MGTSVRCQNEEGSQLSLYNVCGFGAHLLEFSMRQTGTDVWNLDSLVTTGAWGRMFMYFYFICLCERTIASY